MIKLDRLKYGKKNALTLSYDDGYKCDRRLIEIMDRYGIKGTFHLNSGFLDKENTVSKKEIPDLYKNHEVSAHGVLHRTLSTLPQQNVVQEILDDRNELEKASGTFVRGMSYANGRYSDEAISCLKSCGIVYGRTINNTQNFGFPDDFMKWHPTCHHLECIHTGERFLKLLNGYFACPRLFYVWGHSYEFDNDNNWDMIEQFCKMMSGNDEIWYATNIEIYEYITAQKQLIVSSDNKRVYNPTALEIWFTDDEEEYSIAPGETMVIESGNA